MWKIIVTALLFCCALVRADDFEQKANDGVWLMYECQRNSAECQLIVESTKDTIRFVLQMSSLSSKHDLLVEQLFEVNDRQCMFSVTTADIIKEMQASFKDANYASLGPSMMIYNALFVATQQQCRGMPI